MRPYRKERVANVIRDVVAQAMHHRMNDPRIAGLTTVSRVEMTGDLQIAKVYLTVLGDKAAENKTLAAVRHGGGFLQRLVAAELNLRQCPELRFEIDERAKRVQQTLDLLAENRRAEQARSEVGGNAESGTDVAPESLDGNPAALDPPGGRPEVEGVDG